MALIPDIFLQSVISLTRLTQTNQPIGISTGFLYGKINKRENNKINGSLYLVTNRHVLENTFKLELKFDSIFSDNKNEIISLIKDGNAIWTAHPDNEIDVAVIQLNGNYLNENKITHGFFMSDEHQLTIEQTRQENIIEGNGVFLLGYPPLGTEGLSKDFVIVRDGVIS